MLGDGKRTRCVKIIYYHKLLKVINIFEIILIRDDDINTRATFIEQYTIVFFTCKGNTGNYEKLEFKCGFLPIFTRCVCTFALCLSFSY